MGKQLIKYSGDRHHDLCRWFIIGL